MIANVKATEGIGNNIMKKTIHEGSESIMFSVLQETQYMYPVKSCVREIVSNSLDSITERVNSLKILNGELKEEDMYIKKEGTEFAESSFDREYYNEQWLSDNKMVTIRYIDNDTPDRDRIQFIDTGVGLGGSRLINYFSLGFSTKRLSKNQLGSFGLGAKSLLATGIDFYTVTSKYNGRVYKFNVYKDHVASITPKFNDAGEINPEETFYNGFSCYYTETLDYNGVIIEAEVKRHRKQDYISSIENQLGFIKNVELLIADAHYPDVAANKRNIANKVLFETDKILVGESDYYAVPQILLKPGDSSDVMISYGTINFEELEMKKYSGNISFIMNINSVDVTPSRESVIWNSKTREAIKEMFLTAQQTVSDIIADKLADVESLFDFQHLLATFRSKDSISGLSELYKIIDVSKIGNSYKGFNTIRALADLADNEVKNHFIFTSTTNNGMDTAYTNVFSSQYIGNMSNKSTVSKTVVYVGDVKYQGLARYVKDKYNLAYENNIDIVYIKKSLYERHKEDASKGLIRFTEKAYKSKDHVTMLMAEIFGFLADPKTSNRLVLEEDIDMAKMADLAKVAEQAKANRYMTTAERAKAEGKAIGNVHGSMTYTHREYYDEQILEVQVANPVIYQMNDPLCKELFRRASGSIPSGFTIIGFSDENFKRFKEVENVKFLTDCIYKIEFGDLYFTKLGDAFLSSNLRAMLLTHYEQKKDQISFSGHPLYFLNSAFKDIKLDPQILKKETNMLVDRKKKRQRNYIDETKKSGKFDCRIVLSNEQGDIPND